MKATLLMCLALPMLASAVPYAEFRAPYQRFRRRVMSASRREARATGFMGNTVNEHAFRMILPSAPSNAKVPVTCQSNAKNYCNYPDMTIVEETNIHKLMKFPIPSGECPKGYTKQATYDCLNFAPALFETTCCVFSSTTSTEVSVCKNGELDDDFVVDAAAKTCGGTVFVIGTINHDHDDATPAIQMAWSFDQNLKLLSEQPVTLDRIGIGLEDGAVVKAGVPTGECEIDWLSKAGDDYYFTRVKYANSIGSGTAKEIDSANSIYDQFVGANDITAGWGLTSSKIKFSHANFLRTLNGDGDVEISVNVPFWRQFDDPGEDWIQVTQVGDGDTDLIEALIDTNNPVTAAFYNDIRDVIVLFISEGDDGSIKYFERDGDEVSSTSGANKSSSSSSVSTIKALFCGDDNSNDDDPILVYVPIPQPYPPPGQYGPAQTTTTAAPPPGMMYGSQH